MNVSSLITISTVVLLQKKTKKKQYTLLEQIIDHIYIDIKHKEKCYILL